MKFVKLKFNIRLFPRLKKKKKKKKFICNVSKNLCVCLFNFLLWFVSETLTYKDAQRHTKAPI